METSCKQIQGMRFAEQAQVQARADAVGDSAHDSDETVDEPCAHDAHQRDEQLREWRAGRPGASSRPDGGGGKEDSSNDGGDSVTPATLRGDDDSEEEGEANYHGLANERCERCERHEGQSVCGAWHRLRGRLKVMCIQCTTAALMTTSITASITASKPASSSAISCSSSGSG